MSDHERPPTPNSETGSDIVRRNQVAPSRIDKAALLQLMDDGQQGHYRQQQQQQQQQQHSIEMQRNEPGAAVTLAGA